MSKLLVITPLTSPSIANSRVPISGEVSCHALWTKWESRLTE